MCKPWITEQTFSDGTILCPVSSGMQGRVSEMLTYKGGYHSCYNHRKFSVEEVRSLDQLEQILSSRVHISMFSIPG